MSYQVRQVGFGGLGWKEQHRTRASIFNNKLQKLQLAVTPTLMGFITLS